MSSGVPQLRVEGLTERLGDLFFFCSGYSPNPITGTYVIYLPVNVTNRVDTNNNTTQAVLSIDTGLGLTASGIPGIVAGHQLSFNGVTVPVPPGGTFTIKISDVRAAANELGASQTLIASLSTPLALTQPQATLGIATHGLYATLSSSGIVCTNSSLPTNPSMTNLFLTKTAFFSTRVTEGFSAAFGAKAADEDAGTRFVVNYTGFPANAQLYVPDMVGGSSAVVPTGGGDLGVSQSPGLYVPGSGTLLLVRVPGAQASGAGGTRLATPTGGATLLDTVTQVPLTNGSGYVVYEVADSSSILGESAQFPTFVGLADATTNTIANESLSLGAVSTVDTASATDPMPRFVAVTPAEDCTQLGDCQAAYFPKLTLNAAPIQLTASGGAMTGQPGLITFQNSGGGTMIWSATAQYVNSSGWLLLEQTSGVNNGSIRVFAHPQGLAAGTYQAMVVIDGGLPAGSQAVSVTLTVSGAPGPAVMISQIVNAATFQNTPVVPGSVATIFGTHFSGTNVSVTFDSQAATVLGAIDTQINLVVPSGLASQGFSRVIVTVDGISSLPAIAVLGVAYPAIFAHGVRNPDWSENLPVTPAAVGSFLQIFGTGIPTGATVTAQIGSAKNLVPLYAGPAPNVPGVQQVNVSIPKGALVAGTYSLILCAVVNSQPYCSNGFPVSVY